MAESFTLVVNYKGKEYHLASELRLFGYTHKIAITLEGGEILFDPMRSATTGRSFQVMKDLQLK